MNNVIVVNLAGYPLLGDVMNGRGDKFVCDSCNALGNARKPKKASQTWSLMGIDCRIGCIGQVDNAIQVWCLGSSFYKILFPRNLLPSNCLPF